MGPPPARLDPHTHLVLFLHAVSGRASLALPAFYYLVGSQTVDRGADPRPPYDEILKAVSIGFAARTTISMCCRKIFDHEGEGACFKKATGKTLYRCAEYYARDGLRVTEALTILKFLQMVFRRCARHRSELLRGEPSLLESRVAIVKHHADTEAAHITLEAFEFDVFDMAHVVGALGTIGAIIALLDGNDSGRFLEVDESSYRVARLMFSALSVPRLFETTEMPNNLRPYWTFPQAMAPDQILDNLPRAMSWWSSRESNFRPLKIARIHRPTRAPDDAVAAHVSRVIAHRALDVVKRFWSGRRWDAWPRSSYRPG